MNNQRLLPVWIFLVCFVLCVSIFLGLRDAQNRPPAAPPLPEQTSDSATPPAEPTFPDMTMKAEAGRASVIMFHNVIKERTRESVWFDCTVDEFEKDMEEISKNGFTVLSLDQLYKHLTQGDLIPPKSVVLTFDDNYQGFFDNAMPILRKYKFPAAMFVHTAYVGSKQGYPKMTWDELKQLKDEGLVTIGAHTVTHPSNLKDLPPDTQKVELKDSKAALEQHLGGTIVDMAYPDGSNDATTQQLAKEAGYRMAFSTETSTAEGSPNILCVGRYEAKKFDKALQDQTQEVADAPVAIADVALTKAPVSCEAGKFGDTKLVLLHGGTPVSVLASGRKTVGDFVAENSGVAGINGTFFVMAAIASDDNRLIGPSRPQVPGLFVPDSDTYRLTKLVDRPMILWGPTRLAIVPFEPGAMNQEAIFKAYMPDYTDAFLAGAWIVHEGRPRTQEQMQNYASQDITDTRKRAFFGVTKDGVVICGASQGSISTETLGKAAAAAGAYEAILLDSGFSTSVVFDGQILASGHSNVDHPSRPVPHAIVLLGAKGASNLGDLPTVPAVLTPPGTPSTTTDHTESRPTPRRHRRRHRRRATTP